MSNLHKMKKSGMTPINYGFAHRMEKIDWKYTHSYQSNCNMWDLAIISPIFREWFK